VTHLDDPVPRLPPSIAGFTQLFPEYHIDKDDGNQIEVNDMLVYNKPFVPRGLSNIGLDVKAHVHYFGNITSCAYTEKSAGLSLPLRIPKLEGLLNDGLKDVGAVVGGVVNGAGSTVSGTLNGVDNLGNGVEGVLNGVTKKIPGLGGALQLHKLPTGLSLPKFGKKSSSKASSDGYSS
jgi:hypothetical protein